MKGRNSVRVVVLAALVLTVAFSAALGGRFSSGRVTAQSAAGKQSRQRAVQQQRLNSAWQAQLSTEQSQLKQAQQQQAQQTASTPSTLAPPAPAPAAGGVSVPDDIQAAFGSLGATAVQWGLCIAQHESGDDPSAIQVGGGDAEGLFQFEPSTWAATLQGEAGNSVFDPVAASQAAAAFYAAGNYDAWTTNADYCSMYD